jgi:hypothetical protein
MRIWFKKPRPSDISMLVGTLDDERSVMRTLAGCVLTDLCEDGLANLRQAAESQDPVVRYTAESALMDYEIIRSQTQPPE